MFFSFHVHAISFSYDELGRLRGLSEKGSPEKYLSFVLDSSANIRSVNNISNFHSPLNGLTPSSFSFESSNIQNYSNLKLRWRLDGEPKGVWYDVYLGKAKPLNLFKSSLDNPFVNLELSSYITPLQIRVDAYDLAGNRISSSIQTISPLDSDSDGLLDHVEDRLGTSNDLPDSDVDFVSDGAEVKLGTDPLDIDTDKDGVSDGAEVELGTNPLDIDTDKDGITDGKELEIGSDPLERWKLVDFENQTFEPYFWHSDGTLSWVIDNHASDGSYAARSAPVTHRQSSVLETTVFSFGGAFLGAQLDFALSTVGGIAGDRL